MTDPPLPRYLRSLQAGLGLLAVMGGLTGYLALLGGLVLTVRFAHAHLPVTATLALVPPQHLVATAITEVLSKAVIVGTAPFLGIGLAKAAGPLIRRLAEFEVQRGFDDRPTDSAADPETDEGKRRRRSTAKRREIGLNRRLLLVPVVYLLIVVIAMPLDVVGLGVTLTMVGTLGAVMLARARRISLLVTVIFVVAAGTLAPTLSRQAADPLNMELAEIVRAGKPTLVGDLVAVREETVVIGRCGILRVVPIDQGIRIVAKPKGGTTGRSVLQRIGINLVLNSAHSTKPRYRCPAKSPKALGESPAAKP